MESITQMFFARQGIVTPSMQRVAEREDLTADLIRDEVAPRRGWSSRRTSTTSPGSSSRWPSASSAKCKINANIGNSAVDIERRRRTGEAAHAVHFGADTVMDLSTGGDIDAIREAIIDASPVPIGTVPIYQVIHRSQGRRRHHGATICSTWSSIRRSRAWTT